jgi:hypothetical protein
MKYCVYLTTYSGNKLPPFYIGSTSVENVNKGYHGSVGSIKFGEAWDKEQQLNPHLFKTRPVSYHDTRLAALEKEEKFHRLLKVVRSDMYINMAIATPNGCHGMDVSGENNPMYGKKHSENAKNLIGAVHRGKMRNKEAAAKTAKFQREFWSSNSTETQRKREECSKRSSGENNGMYGRRGENSPNLGRKATEQERLNKSKALTGKKKSESHAKKLAKVYVIECEKTQQQYTGCGLTPFCRKIGANPALMIYHLGKEGKYTNGYRLVENLGYASEDIPKLIDIIA